MWATKYRPKQYSEVVGQKDAVAILKSSVGKSTTFILHGPSGVGKTTLARIFADSINGEAIEINGADNNGVDNVRNLISSATYQPVFHDYRVFIIDECHMLTTQAWNALLKILEESPPTTLWMLCTTELSKILPTIKSRSTMVPLRKVSREDVEKVLIKIVDAENKNVDGDTLREIAVHSEGRVREAIVQLETYVETGVLTLPFSTLDIIRIMTAIYQKNTAYVVNATENMTNEDMMSFVRFIGDYLKLLLIRKQLPKSVTTEEILDQFTSISSQYLPELRTLQDALWQAVDTQEDQWEGSVNLLYKFYDRLMTHYNDFRDTGNSLAVPILYMITGL